MLTQTPICFVTGAPQCGKTSFLQQVIAAAKTQNLNLGGFIAIGLWHENRRSGFILQTLATGEQIPLSGRSSQSKEPGGYVFYKDGFAAGLKTLEPKALAGKDLIMVDEVGWLEIRGDGWGPALPYLAKLAVPQIWVVRENLVDEVCATWNFKPALIVNPTAPNARQQIFTWLNEIRR